MERISKEQDMDEDYYDFSNPGSMRKRQKELLRRVEAYREQRKKADPLKFFKSTKPWVLILCHGGNFAYLEFNSQTGKCENHKSDRKYVGRAKQGGR